jgi:MFS family permease
MQLTFSFAMASSSLLMIGFSPIANIISEVFNCSIIVVEAQALIFLAAFIPANFTAIHLLPKKGLRWTVLAGGTFLIVGAWLRLLVNLTGQFYVASIGSVFAAFGQTFFYNCISKLASQWFGDQERTLSTTLGSIAIPIGSIIGFVLPTALISEADVAED